MLVVCGQSRQVYRFNWNGKDLNEGRWVDMAGPMRQPPISTPPNDGDDQASDAWLDANGAVDFVDIDGPAEDDMYAVGDEAWHWNGTVWVQLTIPTDEPLAAIKVDWRPLVSAPNAGLFAYDPAHTRIDPLATELNPPLRDTHQLEAKDGVLWSFGFKDLACFEVQRWTRVDHPDNPSIR